MSDPLDDRLHQAMTTESTAFTPADALGATRVHLLQRVRRRRQRVAATGLAVLLVIGGGTVALATGHIGNSGAHQVIVAGANRTASTSSPPGQPGGSEHPGGSPAPTATRGGPGSHPTGTAPPRGGTTATPTSTSVVAAAPPSTATTSPSATAVPSTTPATTVNAVGHVRGTVQFSAACPAPAAASASGCNPAQILRLGPAHIQLLRGDDSTAAQGNAGSDGQFDLSVAPGTYTVKAQAIASSTATARTCTATPAQITVGSGAVINVSIACAY